MVAAKTSKKKAARKKVSKKRAPKKPARKKAAKKPNTPPKGGRARGKSGAVSAGNMQLPFEGDDTQTDLHYPAGTIANMLGITDRHLRRLANEGIVPKATRGRYPLAGCVQGYITHLQNLRINTGERSDEATRLSKVRADTYELELQVKRGELYERDVVDEALFQSCTTLTAMLDGSANRIASQLGGGAALRKRLLDGFREIRTQYAAGLRDFSERLRQDGWDRRPAARRTTRKVGKRKPRTAKRKS